MSSNDTTPNARPYVYYVSYVTGNPFSFGSVTVARPTPIDHPEILDDLKRQIEDRNGFAGVIILSFQLLSGPTGAAAVPAPVAVPAQV